VGTVTSGKTDFTGRGVARELGSEPGLWVLRGFPVMRGFVSVTRSGRVWVSEMCRSVKWDSLAELLDETVEGRSEIVLLQICLCHCQPV